MRTAVSTKRGKLEKQQSYSWLIVTVVAGRIAGGTFLVWHKRWTEERKSRLRGIKQNGKQKFFWGSCLVSRFSAAGHEYWREVEGKLKEKGTMQAAAVRDRSGQIRCRCIDGREKNKQDTGTDRTSDVHGWEIVKKKKEKEEGGTADRAGWAG